MWQTAPLHFPADHPTAAGHFPGHPILPGALLLDAVLAAVTAPGQDREIVIRAAKFLHPVRPGAALELRWQPAEAGPTRFECRLAGNIAVSGTIELGPARE